MAQDLIEYIQHNSVECLNQCVEDDDLAISLVRQLQQENNEPDANTTQEPSELQETGKIIQSHEDDPQLLIKVPFIVPVKISSIKIDVVSADKNPSVVKVFVDLPNMDFSDVDLPALQVVLNSASSDGGITIPISPVKSRMTKSVNLFLDNPGNKYVAISGITIFGTPDVPKGTDPLSRKGRPWSRKETITAFIRNNVDMKSNKTVMERQRVDLHDLRVPEALMVLKYLTKQCKENNIPYLDIITGKGKHSTDGIAKIKPAVQEWLMSHGFQQFEFNIVDYRSAHKTHNNGFCENPVNTGILRVFF